MTTKTKATWRTVWAVRYDGSRVDTFQANESESVLTVRDPGVAKGGGRWHRTQFEAKFGATRREAIEKFRLKAERDVELAVEELKHAQALVARALELAAAEPQEQVQ